MAKATSNTAATKKETTAKKATPRKSNAAFMAPVQPDAVLGAIVGNKPLSRPEIVKKLWEYIRKNDLQDKTQKTMINTDAAMKAFFDGADKLTMFQMNKQVSLHISKIAEKSSK